MAPLRGRRLQTAEPAAFEGANPSVSAASPTVVVPGMGRLSYNRGMPPLPLPVAEFLKGRTFAVAGVSRESGQTANHIYRKLRASGYDVVPVNPKAPEVEGVTCYPTILAIEKPIDGVVVATPPSASVEIVRQCAARGVSRVWFHRSVGQGSVSDEAVAECHARGLSCIVGGCPLMYCEPVDPVHRCMRWILSWGTRIPG
jgi:uncharacterized protein